MSIETDIEMNDAMYNGGLDLQALLDDVRESCLTILFGYIPAKIGKYVLEKTKKYFK